MRLSSRPAIRAAAPMRRLLSSDSAMEPVPLPEVEQLLLHGIKSIGYNEADAIVMKDAMMWAQLVRT